MSSKKILVVADTHHVTQPLIQAVKREKDLDAFIFLGDFVEDGEKIKKALRIPSHIIGGNGDWSTYYKKEEILRIWGKRLLLVHGHHQGVKNGLQRLYYYALERKVDGVLFAHTHIPLLAKEGDLFMMNPGSPSYPRGGLVTGTYGILHVGGILTGEIKRIR
ncbi:MAG: YfcE family phosphodiesterase [Bacillota bacterium]